MAAFISPNPHDTLQCDLAIHLPKGEVYLLSPRVWAGPMMLCKTQHQTLRNLKFPCSSFMEPSHQAASQTTLSVYHTVRKPKLDRWKEKGGRVGGRECVCVGWGVCMRERERQRRGRGKRKRERNATGESTSCKPSE